MITITDAKYEKDYRIWIKFDDGSSGIVDLKDDLWGPVFEPLRNIAEFKKFVVSDIFHTLVWDNGADFAPEFLRHKMISESKVA